MLVKSLFIPFWSNSKSPGWTREILHENAADKFCRARGSGSLLHSIPVKPYGKFRIHFSGTKFPVSKPLVSTSCWHSTLCRIFFFFFSTFTEIVTTEDKLHSHKCINKSIHKYIKMWWCHNTVNSLFCDASCSHPECALSCMPCETKAESLESGAEIHTWH